LPRTSDTPQSAVSAVHQTYSKLAAKKKRTAQLNKKTQNQQNKTTQREAIQANDKVTNEQRQADLLAAIQRRYVNDTENILTRTRIEELVNDFENLKVSEQQWPTPLPDMKVIYKNFHTEIHKNMHNVVCASWTMSSTEGKQVKTTSKTKTTCLQMRLRRMILCWRHTQRDDTSGGSNLRPRPGIPRNYDSTHYSTVLRLKIPPFLVLH
jgi:hypothetical protein